MNTSLGMARDRLPMRRCAICTRTSGLLAIVIPPEVPGEGDGIPRLICGSCWEIIAEIARRAMVLPLGVWRDAMTEKLVEYEKRLAALERGEP